MEITDQAERWDTLSPEERNLLIAELIGGQLLTQCWIACDGKRLIRTRFTEAEVSELQASLDCFQGRTRNWNRFVRETAPTITKDMRGRLNISIVRWAIRYSDTPGGGWDVIEALAKICPITVSSVDSGWRVTCDTTSWEDSTMQEAACLMALDVFLKLRHEGATKKD